MQHLLKYDISKITPPPKYNASFKLGVITYHTPTDSTGVASGRDKLLTIGEPSPHKEAALTDWTAVPWAVLRVGTGAGGAQAWPPVTLNTTILKLGPGKTYIRRTE